MDDYELQEERCVCGQLLCKYCLNEYIEIKCRRCKRLCIVPIKKLEQMALQPEHDLPTRPVIPAENKKPLRVENGRYVAYKNSDKFHYRECRWAMRISPRNMIVFETRDQAIKAGYKPCAVCEP
jgi:phage FluMu protein Com